MLHLHIANQIAVTNYKIVHNQGKFVVMTDASVITDASIKPTMPINFFNVSSEIIYMPKIIAFNKTISFKLN